MILSQKHQSGTHSLPTETARQLNIDLSSVCRTMDQDLDLRPLGKCKVQKLTDSNIEKRLTHSRKLLSKYTQKALQTAIFTDEKIFKKISKVKQLHNSHNDMVYVPKKMRKVEVTEERLFCENETFPKEMMVFVAISATGKTSIFC